MSDRIAVDPGDFAVINVGDLEHCVHAGVSRFSFTPGDLTHEPLVGGLLSCLLLILDNHDVSRPNRQEGRRCGVGEW